MTTTNDFSFDAHSPNFDEHIGSSIPSLAALDWNCIQLSRRFIQRKTRVIDVGCSSGRVLAAVREHNHSARSDVSYVGIDCVDAFRSHWEAWPDIQFEVCDARSYSGFENMSLAICRFTFQFIPPPDKVPLLRRIHDGLVDGGALIIAEKVLAASARLQDALSFPYYDFKLTQGFTEKDILDKERALRGHMTCWTEVELLQALSDAGFREVDRIWGNFAFRGLLAIK